LTEKSKLFSFILLSLSLSSLSVPSSAAFLTLGRPHALGTDARGGHLSRARQHVSGAPEDVYDYLTGKAFEAACQVMHKMDHHPTHAYLFTFAFFLSSFFFVFFFFSIFDVFYLFCDLNFELEQKHVESCKNTIFA
jgi:hypothetical protein